MRTPGRARRNAATLLGLGLGAALALGGGACTDKGSPEAFCTRLADTPDVATILAALDASDPAGYQRSLEEGLAAFRALEADAPGAVRSDVARVRQGVELVLDAVEDHPDDAAAARAAITQRQDELIGLAQSGAKVAAYARTECDLPLGG